MIAVFATIGVVAFVATMLYVAGVLRLEMPRRRALNELPHGLVLPAVDDPRWKFELSGKWSKYREYSRSPCRVLSIGEVAVDIDDAQVIVAQNWLTNGPAFKYGAAVVRAYQARKALEAITS